MLLRVSLILAILAGMGVIALSHFKVRPQVEQIQVDRETNKQGWNKEKGARQKAEGELATTKTTLNDTETRLTETKTQLDSATAKASSQEQRANGLQTSLDKSGSDLTAARQELNAWTILGIPVDKVKEVIESEKKLRIALEALDAEKQIMIRTITRLTNQIYQLVGSQADYEAPLPPGTKGKVLVVDPKWNFVVLDLGEKNNVVPNGILLVSRDSKLIAKVRIMSVQAERCIANVVPGWKLSEIMEGDQVLY